MTHKREIESFVPWMSDGLAFNNQTENTVFGIDQHTEVQLFNFKLIYPIKVQNFKKKNKLR